MKAAKIVPASVCRDQRQLRVVHVATQAIPFVREDLRRGLSEVAGMTPAAQTRLGMDASLVLPLFKETRQIIAESGLQLQDMFALEVQVGAERREMRVKAVTSPLDPGYPVYFVEDDALFGHDQRYGLPDELERFALFCRAAMKMQRGLGERAPDIFECHDWQTALLVLYLKRTQSEHTRFHWVMDDYLLNARSICAVHGYAHGGNFLPQAVHLAGMGWETLDALPFYAELNGRLNLIKAGLYRADRAYARSLESIEREIDEKHERGFDGIAEERLESGAFVGLFRDDSIWRPGLDYTADVAMAGAKRRLALYRSVLERPFAGMEQAEQTTPPVPYLVLTPAERLRDINEFVSACYCKLEEDERALIDNEILEGRGQRFSGVGSRADLDNILDFLRIKPACDFEAKMRGLGLGRFLDLFYAGDIDRLLSEVGRHNRDVKEEQPLYDFMGGRPKSGGGTLMDHVVRHFQSLDLILKAAEMPEEELSLLLAEKGEFIGEESLAHSTSEFRHLSEVYSSVSLTKYRGYFRAFVIGVLLHDMGQPIDFETHPTEGARLFDRLKASKGFLSEAERGFVRHLIYNHSVFGDIVVIWEQKLDDIFRLADYPGDKALRDLAVKCCYIISIMDMNSIGQRGKLTPYDLKRVREAFQVIIFSKDVEELAAGLEPLGFGKDSGKNRWKNLVVGKVGSRTTKAERVRMRDADLEDAEDELRQYCEKIARAENEELLAAIANAGSDKMERFLQLQLEGKIKEKMDIYYDQLRNIGHVFGFGALKHPPFNARARARLLIWLIEYYKADPYKSYSFRFSDNEGKKQEERQKLAALLDEFDLDKIKHSFNYRQKESQSQLSISVKTE